MRVDIVVVCCKVGEGGGNHGSFIGSQLPSEIKIYWDNNALSCIHSH